jgi:hypothetical protein
MTMKVMSKVSTQDFEMIPMARHPILREIVMQKEVTELSSS